MNGSRRIVWAVLSLLLCLCSLVAGVSKGGASDESDRLLEHRPFVKVGSCYINVGRINFAIAEQDRLVIECGEAKVPITLTGAERVAMMKWLDARASEIRIPSATTPRVKPEFLPPNAHKGIAKKYRDPNTGDLLP